MLAKVESAQKAENIFTRLKKNNRQCCHIFGLSVAVLLLFNYSSLQNRWSFPVASTKHQKTDIETERNKLHNYIGYFTVHISRFTTEEK